MTSSAPVGTLWSVTLDCTDPQPLADFWAAVLGGTVAYTSEQFVGVETPAGVWVGAYHVDDFVPPTWPGEPGRGGKQFHLDLSVADVDAAEARVLALGARKADHQPHPDRWRVFLDPAGHPFCLTMMSA